MIAAIITPTPDPLNQALMAGPIILLYFVSVVGIIITNLFKRRKKTAQVVPEIATSNIEEVLLEDPVSSAGTFYQPNYQKQANDKLTPSPINYDANKIHKHRVISDIVVGSSQRDPVSVPLSSRTLEYRTVVKKREQPERVPIRARLISDFIPAP